MNKNPIFFLLALLSLSLLTCFNMGQGEDKTLVKINDCLISCGKFQQQLDRELNFDADRKLTKEAKEEFLKQLIQEELLIQEAKRLNLDREEKFLRAMECYQRYTLIKVLLEKKGKEISQTVSVPQEEIEAYYERMKESGETVPPLAEIQGDISEELKDKNMSERLSAWIDNLKKGADIKIDKSVLYKNCSKGKS